ncbi:hypothetical protein BGW38_001205 [Lunasporangiospora selenospora]|uniref:Uncharacterized protein n=1 Tax=Lunasporangiospora selenospora TaxID=979761 RepID=A0A9P6G1T7_9FUNG|nr:hypothetical protein BGW38_001205 [Lunasporangiospora selenospora]
MSRHPRPSKYTQSSPPPDIESIRGKDLREIRIHEQFDVIRYEARELKRWGNAFEVFLNYMAPAITSYQLNLQLRQAMTESNSRGWSQAPPTSSAPVAAESTTAIPAKPLPAHDFNRDEITAIGHAIAMMVRYAPSPSEANVIYMFYLQKCTPPILSDDTINHCLVSLIYLYNNVRNNTELQLQGVDLVRVALERGIGLEGYKAVKQRECWKKKPERILNNVSHNILWSANLQISEDGKKLEPLVKQQQQSSQAPPYRKPYETPENRGRGRPQYHSRPPQYARPPQQRQGGVTDHPPNEGSSWKHGPHTHPASQANRSNPSAHGASDPVELRNADDPQQPDPSLNHPTQKQQQQQQRPSSSSSSQARPQPRPQASQDHATDDVEETYHAEPSHPNRRKSLKTFKDYKDKNRSFNEAKSKDEDDIDQYSYYRSSGPSDGNQAHPPSSDNGEDRGQTSRRSGKRDIKFVPASSTHARPQGQDSNSNDACVEEGSRTMKANPTRKDGAKARVDEVAEEIALTGKKIEALRLNGPQDE